jgi:dTDP-4-amino-4,6-dideoxygalactose transaminase
VLNLPQGSEVLMTSINIPDMVQIVKEYGLVPVPVDINVETTAPTLEDIKKVISPKVVLSI